VEDIKLLPGVRRTMFRLQGGEWVAREVVKDVQSGRAKFVLNTGDMVWWGNQGRTVSDSPYWKLVYEDLKQLPAPDRQMRAAGLPGRVFPAVGNHEVWDLSYQRYSPASQGNSFTPRPAAPGVHVARAKDERRLRWVCSRSH
jgi:hypothetical protein